MMAKNIYYYCLSFDQGGNNLYAFHEEDAGYGVLHYMNYDNKYVKENLDRNDLHSTDTWCKDPVTAFMLCMKNCGKL
jgi:hypothetical protein